MTICIATDGFPPQAGGIATFNKHLVSLLTDAGHSVIVLYIDYEKTEEENSTDTQGLLTKVLLRKSYKIQYDNWTPYFRPGGFNAPNWIAIGMAMREWLLMNYKKYNIDIIEASDYGGAGIFLCDGNLPPVVITGHGSLLQFSEYNFNRKDDSYNVITKLEELSYQYANGIITHSLVNKTNLENKFKRDVSLSLMPWKNDTKTKTQNIIPNRLVTIGGLQPVKGAYDMAETMQILQSRSSGIKLFWIGGDTWLAPSHQKMSDYMKKKYSTVWEKTFMWNGELKYDETQQTIASSSIVIIPSIFETFNYVALEAAYLGKAIIITNMTGAASHFTHGIDAWIIPANNPAALAEAIEHLKLNPEQELFVADKIVSERLEIYQSQIKNRVSIASGLNKELNFLNNYHTSIRKKYYYVRSLFKKLINRA
jgi:glycosyltransferase involved in cell wall biosynthesis